MVSNKYKIFNYKTNEFDLESDFIMAFTQNDGFSERLLSYEIYIDKDYHFFCEIGSFKGSILNPDKSFKLQIDSILPNDLRAQISLLLTQNFSNINEMYRFEGLAITDIGGQQILVRINGKTLNIAIDGNLENHELISKNEKRLEKLISDINLWIEKFYEKIT